PATAEVSAQTAHLTDGMAELADTIFERVLVRRQGSIERPDIAGEYPRDFAEAKPERAQLHDVGGTRHFGGAVRTPARRGAAGRDQTTMLVEPERLGGDTELPP